MVTVAPYDGTLSLSPERKTMAAMQRQQNV